MGFGAKTNSNRLLIRSVYGADLHIGSHVRAYAELINGVAGGSNTFGYQTGFQRKRLDMQQGFLEIKGNLLGAKMGAMGGRQYFVDAPLSMICGINSSQQTLSCGFLIPCCTIDLSGKKQSGKIWQFQGRIQGSRINIIIFHGITWPDNHGIFQTWN